MHNPFTNERINVYLDKHNRMSLNTKDYFVKHSFIHSFIYLAIQHTNAFGQYKHIYMKQQNMHRSAKFQTPTIAVDLL